MTVDIRPLHQHDLKHVAQIHRAAFPQSAITRMGIEAVQRYYAWQSTGPHDCHAIGAFIGTHLAGFCFGGTFRGALAGYLRKNRVFLARSLFLRPWLLADPFFRDRLIQGEAVLRRFGCKPRTETAPAVTKQQPLSFGILSIAVDPAYQGQGIGQALMEAAETEARRRTYQQMNLSVSTENEQAIRFYESGGWLRVQKGEQWEGQMVKFLNP